MNSKIKSHWQILKIVEELKKKDKQIVTYNGGFDLIHTGHIHSIEEAKNQGDILIILLNSNISIKKYKGPSRPIFHETERAQILAALECVDYVTIFDEINPKEILNKIKPIVHCNGSDWGRNCIEREVVESNGGKIHVLKWVKGKSTTNILNKIRESYDQPAKRAIFLDRDGTINENKNGYIHKIKNFNFTPNSIKALKLLSLTNYKLFIISNQSGIGRGYYTEKDFHLLNNWMLDKFKKDNITINKVYYCPHSPDKKCNCRKPNIGLLLQAVKEYKISLQDSWIVGDDPNDIIAGREANVKTIKLGEKLPKVLKLEPDYYAIDLLEAAKITQKI